MGGIGRHHHSGCQHPQTLDVRAAGVERSVCQDCGHVSFRDVVELSSTIDRTMFARPVDRVEVMASTSRS